MRSRGSAPRIQRPLGTEGGRFAAAAAERPSHPDIEPPSDEARSALSSARGAHRREPQRVRRRAPSGRARRDALPSLGARVALRPERQARPAHRRRAPVRRRSEFVELGASVTGVDPSDGRSTRARARRRGALIHSELDRCRPSSSRGASTSSTPGGGRRRARETSTASPARSPRRFGPGGDFLLFDEHPAALCVDGLMHWREDYFAQGFRRLGQLVGALGRHTSSCERSRSSRRRRIVPRRARARSFLLQR